MKTLFILLAGILLGVFLIRVYDHRNDSAVATPGNSISSNTEAAVASVGDSVEGKLVQWHLTTDDIKSDLAQTGKVVRAKADVAGETIDDARIDTVIKAKYILDRDVSAVDISVDVSDGRVVLSGRVGSPAIIGRAMELALDTDGVKSVSSDLTIRPLN